MELNNGDLLNSAMSDEPVEQVEVAEAPETEQQEAGQTRDDQGRFAKPEQAVQAEQQSQQREGLVPSGRLREEREAREAIQRQYDNDRATWQRELQAIQARLPKAEQPKAPDVFENPDGFLQHGVQQAIDPVKAEVQQTREYFSRMMAEDKHGADKVKAAYEWLSQGLSSGDPEALATYQRSMRSMHPYGDIVQAHQQRSVYQQIGADPQAWFGKELDTKLSDPKFAGELMQKIQAALQGQNNPQAQNNTFQVPPRLRNAPGARAGSEGPTDMSNASLLAEAMR